MGKWHSKNSLSSQRTWLRVEFFSFPTNEAKWVSQKLPFSEGEHSRPSLKMCPGRELAHFLHFLELWIYSITLIFCLMMSENAGSLKFLFRTYSYYEFSGTVKGITAKIEYFGLEKCLECVFSKPPPICTVQFNHWLPCYFLTRFFMRFKKKIAGSKPTMPSEYVSTGHTG